MGNFVYRVIQQPSIRASYYIRWLLDAKKRKITTFLCWLVQTMESISVSSQLCRSMKFRTSSTSIKLKFFSGGTIDKKKRRKIVTEDYIYCDSFYCSSIKSVSWCWTERSKSGRKGGASKKRGVVGRAVFPVINHWHSPVGVWVLNCLVTLRTEVMSNGRNQTHTLFSIKSTC